MGKPQSQRKNHPFAGSAVIDIDNSGKELVFVGMGKDQNDILLKYDPKTNKLINIIENTGLLTKSSLEPTHAAVAFDMTNNGFNDLLVARPSGVYIYLNNGGKFKEKLIYGPFIDSEPLALSIGDYNKNKLPDIYISRFTKSEKLLPYQFNNPKHYRENILLRNKGNLEFEDVTIETNTGGNQNTFTSIFVDLGSKNVDLLLAHDNGQIELFKNKGNGKFESKMISPLFGFWMGIAVGDYNNDGKLDFFFTNIGNSLPVPKSGGVKGNPNKGGLLEGQILTNQHLLFENKGNYNFKNVSDIQNTGDYGFSWGTVMEDINLNGKLDIIFAQNYVDFAALNLKGVVLMNKGDSFERVDALQNPYFGQTPVFVDFNGQGSKDMVWINMDGPIFGYKIDNKENNNYLSVKMPNNIDYLNANITLTYDKGKQIRQHIVGGVGFGGGQSQVITFGLGKSKKVESLDISTIYGKNMSIKNPKINTLIKL